MANINIRRDVTDPFYRYKMERLQSKIEGKGNGIKTVIVNLSNVADQLARPPSHLIKYFGFELGAQTNIDPKDDRWIINGAHEASKLQDYLDGFILKFVLCKNCKNPETVVNIKDTDILLDCKACGQITRADPRHKLSSFILKSAPKKGKKDKSTKKADRKARREAEKNGTADGDHNGNGHLSPGDSGSDQAGDNDADLALDAGSDDELTRKINAGAKELDQPEHDNDVQWSVDMSDEAIKARAKALPEDLKQNLVIDDDADDADRDTGAANPYDELGKWIDEEARRQGSVSAISDVDVYLRAKELGVESKHRTLTVLAQCLFDADVVKQMPKRAAMLKKMLTSDKHEKAFLGGLERLVGVEQPKLIDKISSILIQIYDADILPEDTLQAWCSKASKKYVDLAVSRDVRKHAKPFLKWLEEAEEEDDDDDDDDE